MRQNERLLRGVTLAEGDLLVEIDPRDYEAILEQEKASLARALFDLKVEEGRQVVARREWGLLKGSIEKKSGEGRYGNARERSLIAVLFLRRASSRA